jgi:hypothetical protein
MPELEIAVRNFLANEDYHDNGGRQDVYDNEYVPLVEAMRDAIDWEPNAAQMEAMVNPDSGPVRTEDSPAYRDSMRDAGRGGLLR